MGGTCCKRRAKNEKPMFMMVPMACPGDAAPESEPLKTLLHSPVVARNVMQRNHVFRSPPAKNPDDSFSLNHHTLRRPMAPRQGVDPAQQPGIFKDEGQSREKQDVEQPVTPYEESDEFLNQQYGLTDETNEHRCIHSCGYSSRDDYYTCAGEEYYDNLDEQYGNVNNQYGNMQEQDIRKGESYTGNARNESDKLLPRGHRPMMMEDEGDTWTIHDERCQEAGRHYTDYPYNTTTFVPFQGDNEYAHKMSREMPGNIPDLVPRPAPEVSLTRGGKTVQFVPAPKHSRETHPQCMTVIYDAVPGRCADCEYCETGISY